MTEQQTRPTKAQLMDQLEQLTDNRAKLQSCAKTFQTFLGEANECFALQERWSNHVAVHNIMSACRMIELEMSAAAGEIMAMLQGTKHMLTAEDDQAAKPDEALASEAPADGPEDAAEAPEPRLN